jgi:hypothetical protein
MRVIRQKADKTLIKAYGYTDKGGLGKFDESLFEEVELDKLPEGWRQYVEPPQATGIELINFINNSTIATLSDEEAFALVQKVQPFIMFLQQGRCNPLSRETFRTALGLLDKSLDDEGKEIVVKLLTGWTKDKVFAPDKALIESKQ